MSLEYSAQSQEAQIQSFVDATLKTIKLQIAGKTFTLLDRSTKKEIKVTISKNPQSSGSALWDSQSPGFVYATEEGIDHSVVTSFSGLLSSKEGSELLNDALENVPKQMRDEVKKIILESSN